MWNVQRERERERDVLEFWCPLNHVIIILSWHFFFLMEKQTNNFHNRMQTKQKGSSVDCSFASRFRLFVWFQFIKLVSDWGYGVIWFRGRLPWRRLCLLGLSVMGSAAWLVKLIYHLVSRQSSQEIPIQCVTSIRASGNEKN